MYKTTGLSLTRKILSFSSATIGLASWWFALFFLFIWRSLDTMVFWNTIAKNPEIQIFGFWKYMENGWLDLGLFIVLLVIGSLSVYSAVRDVKQRRFLKASSKLVLMFLLLMVSASFTIQPLKSFASSPTSGPVQLAYDTGYGTSCSASFCIFTNTISSVQYYYAMVGLGYNAGSSCTLSTCAVGGIAFGGPNNAGGVSALKDIVSDSDASTKNGGVIMFEGGNFTSTNSFVLSSGHALTIDGQGRSTQINWGGSYSLFFAAYSNAANLVIENLFLNDSSPSTSNGYGILIGGSTSTTRANNDLVRNVEVSGSGIKVNADNSTVSNCFVHDITSSSIDRAIGMYGVNDIVTNNRISNVEGMGISGFGDSGPSVSLAIQGNTLIKTGVGGSSFAIDTSNSYDVSVSYNDIVNSKAGAITSQRITESNGYYWTASFNSIVNATSSNPLIDIFSDIGLSGITVTQNTVTGYTSNPTLLELDNVTQGSISYNSLYGSGQSLITVTETSHPSNDLQITNNYLQGWNQAAGFNVGVNLESGVDYISMKGNTLNGTGVSNCRAIGFTETGGTHSQFIGNTFLSCTNPFFDTTYNGEKPPNATLVAQNVGFDSYGKILNPWGSTTVGPIGTHSTPGASGGTYTIIGMSQAFACTGGGTVSIAFKDSSGNTIASSLTCSSAQLSTYWPVGDKVTVTNSSDFTSFSSFGN